MGLVHHTDAQRECADDRAAPHVVALDRPSLSRWVVADMRHN
jgi:hypothetical protein